MIRTGKQPCPVTSASVRYSHGRESRRSIIYRIMKDQTNLTYWNINTGRILYTHTHRNIWSMFNVKMPAIDNLTRATQITILIMMTMIPKATKIGMKLELVIYPTCYMYIYMNCPCEKRTRVHAYPTICDTHHMAPITWLPSHCSHHMAPITYLSYRDSQLWPLFTKQTDVLPQDIAKYRSHEIRVYTISIAPKFDRHLGSSSAKMLIKLQSDTIISRPIQFRDFET